MTDPLDHARAALLREVAMYGVAEKRMGYHEARHASRKVDAQRTLAAVRYESLTSMIDELIALACGADPATVARAAIAGGAE